jgi:hypothetical protein
LESRPKEATNVRARCAEAGAANNEQVSKAATRAHGSRVSIVIGSPADIHQQSVELNGSPNVASFKGWFTSH